MPDIIFYDIDKLADAYGLGHKLVPRAKQV